MTAQIDGLTEAWKDSSVSAGGESWGARGERGVPGTPKGVTTHHFTPFSEKSPSFSFLFLFFKVPDWRLPQCGKNASNSFWVLGFSVVAFLFIAPPSHTLDGKAAEASKRHF